MICRKFLANKFFRQQTDLFRSEKTKIVFIYRIHDKFVKHRLKVFRNINSTILYPITTEILEIIHPTVE